ncbi:MAG: ribosome assembly cofactor RimP [Bacteroidales bacterium]|nr:ribosome assembly cofactor RimP [Bacteroidales bacterium]
MIEKGLISNLAEEAIRDTDLFLVEVKVKPGNVIEVFLDSDTAVNIDQCVAVSRFIEGKMDRDVEDFELSVLSYGLSGALKLPRQFAKYLNKEVEVKTKEQGKIAGTLVAYDGQQVTIKPTPAKKTSKRKPAIEGDLCFELGQVSVYPAIVF